MIARTVLGILAVIGFTVLAYPPQAAKAQMQTEQKAGVASAEKSKAKVSKPRKARAHYRHRGGQHPRYGGRY